jgi:enoyl-CoA hydratase/carnithine racemase
MANEGIGVGAEEAVVLSEKRGAVAWVTLNRPDALNAINNAVRAALPKAIRDADEDPSVRVIVVRGAGPRGFCAGADIKEFSAAVPAIQRRQALVHEAWVAAFDRARKPIIASIHGFCLGGGLEIAVACDLRIAAEDAVLGYPEVGLGLITGAGGSQKLLRIVGLGRALDMMLTTERMNAVEAHRVGLVTRLAKPGALEEQTRALAEKIAGLPPMAVAFAKEVLRKGLDADLETACRLVADLFSLLLTTNDRLEAAAAFKEKRSPKFTGT